MYLWYALADVCYAFLVDVPAGDVERRQRGWPDFRRSRWFTRAWTLQELIAPAEVVFLAQDWTQIGSKVSLGDLIAEITKIEFDALLHVAPLEEFSVAQRFSWAADREATRVEDRAYSLLGILDINMPTLYGEGERAFRRLQEEIMRRTPDQSLFVWTDFKAHPLSRRLQANLGAQNENVPLSFYQGSASSLLAPSLNVFSDCEDIKALSHDEVLRRLQLATDDLPAIHYDFTPYGICVQLPVIHFESSGYFPPGCADSANDVPFSHWYLVILECEHRDFPGHLLGRVCYTNSAGLSINFLYSGYVCDPQERYGSASDLVLLSPTTIARLHSSHISPSKLYIPQLLQSDARMNTPWSVRIRPHKTINLILSKKTRDGLYAQGYMATLCIPDDVNATTHSVTLSHDSHIISINYQHTLNTYTSWHQALDIQASVMALVRRPGRSPSPNSQDTAYSLGVVRWSDHRPWCISLALKDVELDMLTPYLESTLSLGLDFIATNLYALSIEFKANPPGTRSRSRRLLRRR
uniref:Carboxylic ester hydrolase (EC) n=1 Tax=Ganoderma boninense TaxID=34458 RepID=A0A5K1K3B2_9APHY|nr:Carboxylic ester hydrolase (EC [Ganoderma boninense]